LKSGSKESFKKLKKILIWIFLCYQTLTNAKIFFWRQTKRIKSFS